MTLPIYLRIAAIGIILSGLVKCVKITLTFGPIPLPTKIDSYPLLLFVTYLQC